MKLVILKLLSLLVFVLGAVSLLLALGLPEIQGYLQQVPGLLEQARGALPEQFAFLRDVLTVQGLWFTGSVVAIVFGIYGFTPRMKKWRKPKKIKYDGPHGEVQIQLDTVEESLNQVLARMPEIKKIDVKVEPKDGGRRALIRADVVLNQQVGQNARAVASLVSDYISETATKLLGIEDLATIEMKVVGIVVNSKRSSRAIREESLSHMPSGPVALLEASPASVSRAGYGRNTYEQVLGEAADEAEAVELERADLASQAAARSELLEPLSVGQPISAPAPHGESPAATRPMAEAAATVAPLAMDVLDEPLHSADDAFEGADEDDDEPVYRSGLALGSHDDTDAEGALDDDPAYGGQLANPASAGGESQPSPFAEPVEEDSEGATGNVTIPEQDGDERKGWSN